MVSKSDVERLLLQAIAAEWLVRYLAAERRVRIQQRSINAAVKRTEIRARAAYRDALGGFKIDNDGRIRPSLLQVRRSKARLEEVYQRTLGDRGELRRKGRKNLTESADLARKFIREYEDSLNYANRLIGDEELDLENISSNASSRSKWAFDRDIEQMSSSVSHKAGLGVLAFQDRGDIRGALRSATRATAVNKRSVLNTFSGTSRHAVRATVHDVARKSGGFSRWLGISTTPKTSYSLVALTESQWQSRARSGLSLNPGNPVSGFGLHVGSKSYFAPVPANIAALCLALFFFGSERLEKKSEPASVRDLFEFVFEDLDRKGKKVQKKKTSTARKVTESVSKQAEVNQISGRLISIDKGFTSEFKIGQRYNLLDNNNFVIGEIELIQSFPGSSVGFLAYRLQGANVALGNRVVPV